MKSPVCVRVQYNKMSGHTVRGQQHLFTPGPATATGDGFWNNVRSRSGPMPTFHFQCNPPTGNECTVLRTQSINFDQFPRRQTRVPVNLKQTDPLHFCDTAEKCRLHLSLPTVAVTSHFPPPLIFSLPLTSLPPPSSLQSLAALHFLC